MRMSLSLVLASLCTLLISCASLNMGGETTSENQETSNVDGTPDLGIAPQAYADPAYAAHEMSDIQAPAEIQAAEQQTAQTEQLNEQRSTSELDAAAPETGTDTFHASTQIPDIEAMTPSTEIPTQLPEKTGASWDQVSAASTYEEPQEEKIREEKPVYKKSKKSSKVSKKTSKKGSKIAKKMSKKHSKIAKKHKKSKRNIAKFSKKSKKSIVKKSKSKVDCKKIAKGSKKSTKKAVAMCKAGKKKVASSGKKHRKVASTGDGSSSR